MGGVGRTATVGQKLHVRAHSPAPWHAATIFFKVGMDGVSIPIAGIVLKEQGMIVSRAVKKSTLRISSQTAVAFAAECRVGRTEAAEGGTYISEEIGGLGRPY